MSKIVSIGTATPAYCHRQMDILPFMQTVYATSEAEKRKLRFLYQQSGIGQRYSVIADYGRPVNEWKFFPPTENLEPFPSLEQRMAIYDKQAPLLAVDAVRDCLQGITTPQHITHLITVSCTGMSAPGLDLQVMELMDLNKNIFRTSVNFMGCYAAIHALKMADAFCKTDSAATVLIVCAELCTLHFQREPTVDNITSSLLFSDGCAAALVCSNERAGEGITLTGFHSEVIPKGKRDMAWELSSSGFLMRLSGYVPDLIEEDFLSIVNRALQRNGCQLQDVQHWCIHPGGKKIMEAVERSLHLSNEQLLPCYDVLYRYGNMSSATILFVLKEMKRNWQKHQNIFASAFGPGLTVETFTAIS